MFTCRNPNAQYNSIRRWRLWRCLDHEGGALRNGINFLKKGTPKGSPASFIIWEKNWKSLTMNPVVGYGLVAKSCPTLATPWTVAFQAALSMGFYRQEYWSGLPFPSPGDHPNSGIEPGSPALQSGSLPAEQATWTQ